MRLVYADSATEDLIEIHAYIAHDSLHQADRMVERIATACRRLTTFPLIGRSGRTGARELTTVSPYVIVYRVEPDLVLIERVLHGARRR